MHSGSRSRIGQFLFLAIALLTLFLSTASATIVFNQPHTGSSTLYQSSTWDPDGSDYDQWRWDRFSLASNTGIVAVNWRGGGAGHTIVNFTVSIYASIPAGTQPDLGYLYTGPLVSYNTSSYTQTAAGTFGGVPMYDYHYVLPSPFQATAGTYYWIYIIANEAGLPSWGLAQGGTGSHFRCYANVGDRFYQNASGDIAFSLESSDQPTINITTSVQPVGTGTVQGAGAYPAGSTVSLLALPATNYGFVNWTENGNVVSTQSPYNFTATANRSLVGHFAPAYTITLYAQPQAGGTVTGGGTYTEGGSVTVTATPNTGYTFGGWQEGGSTVSTSATYTFTAAYSRYLYAVFNPAGATSLYDFDTGTPSVSPGQTMPSTQTNAGLTASFTALSSGFWSIQNTIYGFVPTNFSGNFLYPSNTMGSIQVAFSSQLTSVTIAYCTGELAADYDVASLVRITGYNGSVSTTPVGSASTRGAWISGSYPQGAVTFSSTTSFNVIKIDIPPNQGNPVSGLLFVDNIVAQRVATPTYTITTSASPVSGGTTSGGGQYLSGASVTVSATASTGYQFVNWTEGGTAVSTAADYTFTVSANRNLTANFITSTYDLTLTASPAAGGSVTGAGAYTIGTYAAISATPATGYVFTRWDQHNVPYSNWSSESIYMDSARSLTAVFAPAITITAGSTSADGAVFGTGDYAVGQPVELRAVPHAGKAFSRWVEGTTTISYAAVYNFTASTSRILSAVFEADTLSATFDFDTGTPTLLDGSAMPSSQTANGWTAYFSVGSGSFTVESPLSTGWQLSRMANHFLFPVTTGSTLYINFDRPVNRVDIGYATCDFQMIQSANPIQLTAWSDSAGTISAGTVTSAGVILTTDLLPTGTITLQANAIRRVRIDMPVNASGTVDFLIDNITVRKVPQIAAGYTGVSPSGTTTLSWLAPCSGYTVESSTNPYGTVWQPVTTTIQVVNGQHQISVPSSSGQEYFRLHHP